MERNEDLMTDVTHILESMGAGNPNAAERLLPLVYEELRKLAAHKMAHEAAGHTLQPTALVHEAWLRVAGAKEQSWQNRAHFFGAAAEAMRRILIENVRRKRALCHGGGQERINVMEVEIAAPTRDDELLAVNDALERFAAIEQEKAELVKLRFFAGLKIEEAAQILEISVPTAKRWWAYARAWLYQETRSAI
jgi:RNA polymerase sigma factor (TIGR02999 family)